MRNQNLSKFGIAFPLFYKMYVGCANPIFTSYGEITSVISPYSLHLFLCQLISPPAFLISIVHVLDMFPKKQVTRVYAWRCIAFMKYTLTIRDGSYIQFPRYSMGANDLSFGSDMSVSILVPAPTPQPTTAIWFWNDIFFKTVFNWNALAIFRTFWAAILALFMLFVHEWFFTGVTNKDSFHNHLRYGFSPHEGCGNWYGVPAFGSYLSHIFYSIKTGIFCQFEDVRHGI